MSAVERPYLPPCEKCGLRHGKGRGGFGYRMAGCCSICGRERDVKGRRYCSACEAQYRSGHRRKYGDMPLQERRRVSARTYAHACLRRGRLKRGPCAGCGATEGVKMHHADYAKPLEVTWLCAECEPKGETC